MSRTVSMNLPPSMRDAPGTLLTVSEDPSVENDLRPSPSHGAA